VGLPSDLLRRRPDIRQAERSLAAATADIGVQVSSLFPKITLTAQYGGQSGTALNLVSAAARFFTLGPQIKWGLLNYSATKANIRASEAKRDQQYLTYQKTVLTAFQDVENALVSEQLRIGASVDDALETLKRRLPSRELAVLVSTLVIQQRTGGDVVTALRDMAETLETRKDLRREVRTMLASAIHTGYVTGGLGLLLILLANLLQPGMIDLMARRPLGQVALATSAGLYVLGWTMARRMTDIDV
jgi:hypothetical protein